MGDLATIAIGIGIVVVFAWVGFWVANHTAGTVVPVQVDATFERPAAFYRTHHGRPEDDVALGSRWRTPRDPGAAFSLTWLAGTSAVVVMRRQRMAQAVVPGGLSGAFGMLGRPRVAKRVTGMKTIGTAVADQVTASPWRDLEAEPDGLDQLCQLWDLHYEPPEGAATWAEQLRTSTHGRPRHPDNNERVHADWVDTLPAIGMGLALVVIGAAVVSDGGQRLNGSWADLWPWVALVVVLGAVVVIASVSGRYVVAWGHARAVHREHDDERRARPGPGLAPRAHRRDEG